MESLYCQILRASETGNKQVIEILLETYPELRDIDVYSFCLESAIMYLHNEVIDFLLQLGAQVYISGIRLAVKTGDYDIFCSIVNRYLTWGRPFCYYTDYEAVGQGGNIDIIKYFISNTQTDKHEKMFEDMIYGAALANKETVVDYIASIRGKDGYLFSLLGASSGGHYDLVKSLLTKYEVGFNELAHSFVKACSNGHLDIAKYLHTVQGVDPSVFDNRALLDAADKNQVEIIRFLFEDPRVDRENYLVRQALKNRNI